MCRRTAARSLGRKAQRSGRPNRLPRRSGSCGRRPVAFSTASGNPGRMAVASAISGVLGSSRQARPAQMPTAVCGSTSWSLARSTAAMVVAVSSSSTRAASNSSRARPSTSSGIRRPSAPRIRPAGARPRRHHSRTDHTAGARNCSRPGCPCSGSSSAPPRPRGTRRSQRTAPGCRCGWSRRSAGRSAGPRGAT